MCVCVCVCVYNVCVHSPQCEGRHCRGGWASQKAEPRAPAALHHSTPLQLVTHTHTHTHMVMNIHEQQTCLNYDTIPSNVVNSLMYSLFQRMGNSSSLKMREKSAIRITPEGLILIVSNIRVNLTHSLTHSLTSERGLILLSQSVKVSLTLFNKWVNLTLSHRLISLTLSNKGVNLIYPL